MVSVNASEGDVSSTSGPTAPELVANENRFSPAQAPSAANVASNPSTGARRAARLRSVRSMIDTSSVR
jgi:hypothetical protein